MAASILEPLFVLLDKPEIIHTWLYICFVKCRICRSEDGYRGTTQQGKWWQSNPLSSATERQPNNTFMRGADVVIFFSDSQPPCAEHGSGNSETWSCIDNKADTTQSPGWWGCNVSFALLGITSHDAGHNLAEYLYRRGAVHMQAKINYSNVCVEIHKALKIYNDLLWNSLLKIMFMTKTSKWIEND